MELLNTTEITNQLSPEEDDPHAAPAQGAMVALGALFALGAAGNAAALRSLRRRRSRVARLLTHLAVADCAVACGVIPLEIGWKYTNAWLAGNAMCKLLQTLRAFSLYLSSNVLVCISLDRFFAVVHPLRAHAARRRGGQLLRAAWGLAALCSLPQSVVFRVRRHPARPHFEQCVSFGAFPSRRLEVAYSVACVCAVYVAPLALVSACYVAIFARIRGNSREMDAGRPPADGETGVRLRRSGRGLMERARRRTLRMTVTIVAAFALCWAPYAFMAMWYQIDPASARGVSRRTQDLLFAMAVSNSCVNPLVYGSYAVRAPAPSRLLRRLLRRLRRTDRLAGLKGSLGDRQHENGKQPTKTAPARTKLGVRFAETCLGAADGPPVCGPPAPLAGRCPQTSTVPTNPGGPP